MKKFGIETPADGECRWPAWSASEPRRTAAMVPSGMATSNDQRRATSAELEGGGKPLADRGRHGLVGGDRAAQVAVHEVAKPDHVLDVERLVQAELLVDCGDRLRRLRSSPRMISAGSPGVRWMSMNTPMVTRKATGTISSEPAQDVGGHAGLSPASA